MTPVEREALRYLGTRQADDRTLALVRDCFLELEAAVPRHVLATLTVDAVNEAFQSDALREHLAGCADAVLLAATLGTQADQLIRRAEASDTLRAAALHACAAAKIEAYCDAVQASIPGAGRSRFSPGYGDFPLSKQQTLLSLTDAGRRIGLYLTDGCMLVPTKSVTAVMGLGGKADGCGGSKCERCGKADCAFREAEAPKGLRPSGLPT